MAEESAHMAKIKDLTDAFIKNNETEDNTKIVEVYKIIKAVPELSILSLVEALSEVLTNENVEIRLKGTKLIAEYIHLCEPDDLVVQEIETLILFFCDRLKDHHSIQPLVIYGFLGIVSHQKVSDELIIKMLQTIFAEVHIQSLVQADRRNVFNLFGNLLKLKLNVLRSISSDFVLGFIQAMDSERDPRNLLLCFDNCYIVIKELDFSLFAEDFFEVLSCYFPIDFTPPKDNQFEITRDDLILGLRRCLISTPLFAPYAIPLYIEKLSSDIVDAKKDSLRTFTEGLPLFTGEQVELFINDIWMSIRKDFLLGDIKELHSSYIDFIKALVQCLLNSNCMDSLYSLVGFLLKDCLQTLKDPDMTIAVQCGELVNTFSKLSNKIFEKIVATLLPPIEVSISKYSSPQQRKNLFELVEQILNVDSTLVSDSEVKQLLVAFVEKHLSILFLYLQDDDHSELKKLSIACLTEVVKFNAVFNVSPDLLCEHVFKIVFSTVLPQSIADKFNSLVYQLALNYADNVDKSFITLLENEGSQYIQQCIPLLYHCQTHFKERILRYLVTVITKTLGNEDQEIFNVAVKCLCNVLVDSESRTDKNVVLQPILQAIYTSTQVPNSAVEGLILAIASAYKNLEESQKLEFLVQGAEILQKDEGATSPQDFNVLVSIVAIGIIGQANKVLLTEIDVKKLVLSLWKLMMAENENQSFLQYGGLCIATLVNKSKDFELIRALLDLIEENLKGIELCESSVHLLAWVTKGCVLNWQTSTQRSLHMLIDSLKQPSIGHHASRGFEILVRDETLALTKESGAVITFMYKQRFSQFVLPLLMESYHNAENEAKAYLITAISCTLQMMPKQMLQVHLKKLMPLLMHSLANCPSDDILQSTISTILSVCDQNKEIIEEYVESLVPRLLTMVSHARMKIRMVSLQCLSRLSTYSTHVVLPMRNDVTRRMRVVLDDPKRLVRKEAVNCSNTWHLLG